MRMRGSSRNTGACGPASGNSKSQNQRSVEQDQTPRYSTRSRRVAAQVSGGGEGLVLNQKGNTFVPRGLSGLEKLPAGNVPTEVSLNCF